MRGLAALVGLALAPAATVTAQQPDQIQPTFVLDRKGDARGPLDVVRVAMSRRTNGRLRGEVTMRRPWDTADLRPGGSICLKLYVGAEPDAEPPEHLVCATPPAAGEELVGRVLRNRANGLPRTVAAAAVSRPTRRTVYLRFAPSAIRRPASMRFAAEALTRGEGCPRAVGCADLAPDAPGTRIFRLHPDTSPG